MPRLTDEEIARMKELDGKATAGPWYPGHLSDPSIKCDCPYVFDENHMGSVCEVSVENERGEGWNDSPKREEAEANQLFIAFARSFVPRALADLEELRNGMDRIDALAQSSVKHDETLRAIIRILRDA